MICVEYPRSDALMTREPCVGIHEHVCNALLEVVEVRVRGAGTLTIIANPFGYIFRVPLEDSIVIIRLGTLEHAWHPLCLAHVPITNVLVEGGSPSKRVRHRFHITHVPVTDGLVKTRSV